MTAFHRIAKSKDGREMKKDPRIESLILRVSASVSDESERNLPRHISNTAWAVAKLNLLDTALIHALSTQALANISEFEPHSLGSIAWALAGMRDANGPIMSALCIEALQKFVKFDERGLSNMVWSFAHLR